MEAVIRGLVVYVVLMVIFRLSGKRSLAQITTFDFVLLLIISETVQQAMLDNDSSLTNAFLLVVTLMFLDVMLSLLKQRSKTLEKVMDSVPVLIVENGKPLKDRMNKERVDEEDILTAARELQGLERMDQIKYAVLERSGGITVVPRDDSR